MMVMRLTLLTLLPKSKAQSIKHKASSTPIRTTLSHPSAKNQGIRPLAAHFELPHQTQSTRSNTLQCLIHFWSINEPTSPSLDPPALHPVIPPLPPPHLPLLRAQARPTNSSTRRPQSTTSSRENNNNETEHTLLHYKPLPKRLHDDPSIQVRTKGP